MDAIQDLLNDLKINFEKNSNELYEKKRSLFKSIEQECDIKKFKDDLSSAKQVLLSLSREE